MPPSLVDLCVQSAIDNVGFLEDVGDTDLNLLKLILPHCTRGQLMRIEESTRGRDLSPVTDELWRIHYRQYFGKESANLVIERMEQKKISFKWFLLYKAKLKERDEAHQKTADRMKELYAEVASKRQSRTIRVCSKVPPTNKRRFNFTGSGSYNNLSNIKGSLMKKAKIEYLNSHEAKIHADMRKKEASRKFEESRARQKNNFLKL